MWVTGRTFTVSYKLNNQRERERERQKEKTYYIIFPTTTTCLCCDYLYIYIYISVFHIFIDRNIVNNNHNDDDVQTRLQSNDVFETKFRNGCFTWYITG